MGMPWAVEVQIRARFAPAVAERVRLILEEARLPKGELGARVQMAVLKLAAGEFDSFADALRLAETDWRDALVAAGLEHDNWPEVLREAGMSVPQIGLEGSADGG